MAGFDPDYVRGVSMQVYRMRLGNKDADAMIAEKGMKYFRNAAGSLDTITRCYLDVLMEVVEVEQPTETTAKPPGV